jgi:hypothetical protein
MANKVYQLPLDTELDRDILDWLDSLPRSRKAEIVRTALRLFIVQQNSGNGIPIPIVTTKQTEQKSRKRGKLNVGLQAKQSEKSERARG